MNQAVSISGQPYSSLPNAFKYRTEFNPSCSCKAAGQTWSDALKSIDDKAAAEQQGDIIVTEESAKKMSQPRAADGRRRRRAKKGAAPATTAPARRRLRPSHRHPHAGPQPTPAGKGQADPFGRPDLHPRALISSVLPLERFRRSAAGARHQRLVRFGSALPGSRNLLVMG